MNETTKKLIQNRIEILKEAILEERETLTLFSKKCESCRKIINDKTVEMESLIESL